MVRSLQNTWGYERSVSARAWSYLKRKDTLRAMLSGSVVTAVGFVLQWVFDGAKPVLEELIVWMYYVLGAGIVVGVAHYLIDRVRAATDIDREQKDRLKELADARESKIEQLSSISGQMKSLIRSYVISGGNEPKIDDVITMGQTGGILLREAINLGAFAESEFLLLREGVSNPPTFGYISGSDGKHLSSSAPMDLRRFVQAYKWFAQRAGHNHVSDGFGMGELALAVSLITKELDDTITKLNPDTPHSPQPSEPSSHP